MKTRDWYQARIRWAEMVEGRGIRKWEEAVYLFGSEDFDSVFQRALELGEGGQSGGEEGRRSRWVETRLAEVVTLDCLGSELDGVLEVHWMPWPADEKIPFEHKFEPAKKAPVRAVARAFRSRGGPARPHLWTAPASASP
jgi:hypothetical protein